MSRPPAVDPGAEVPPAASLGRVHFVGIGGVGMSGIARILLARGMSVSGSDARDSRGLAGLRALGARIQLGHDGAHVLDVDTVVVGSAIRPTNPELVAARERGLRVLHRSQALASLMAGRRTAAVAGTHGKTTTTSMLTVTLQHCGADPSFAIGGELTAGGANAHEGSGDIFVAEADESDESFLLYRPTVAVVTNVEADHLDHYGTADAVYAAFDRFCRRVLPGGVVVACADDPGAARMADRARQDGVRVRSYGESPGADVRLVDLDLTATGASFGLTTAAAPVGRVSLQLPGRHNALNAAAAFTAATSLGQDPDLAREGLSTFTGTRRRFELRGTRAGVRVVDDYSHHPTEVAAVLRAARPVAGRGRVIAVFQPHLFSRTLAFAAEFGQALALADVVVVMDIYAAREDPQPGITGVLVADAVPLPDGRVFFEPSWSAVAGLVASLARPGDVVLTLGAGDVTLLGPQILEALGPAVGEPSGLRDGPTG